MFRCATRSMPIAPIPLVTQIRLSSSSSSSNAACARTTATSSPLYELYYDGKCPMCVHEVNMLRSWDTSGGGRIGFVDISTPDGLAVIKAKRLPSALQMQKILHGRVVAEDKVVKGMDAVRALYRASAATDRTVFHSPTSATVTDAPATSAANDASTTAAGGGGAGSSRFACDPATGMCTLKSLEDAPPRFECDSETGTCTLKANNTTPTSETPSSSTNAEHAAASQRSDAPFPPPLLRARVANAAVSLTALPGVSMVADAAYARWAEWRLAKRRRDCTDGSCGV